MNVKKQIKAFATEVAEDTEESKALTIKAFLGELCVLGGKMTLPISLRTSIVGQGGINDKD